jgi:hypothetical protein
VGRCRFGVTYISTCFGGIPPFSDCDNIHAWRAEVPIITLTLERYGRPTYNLQLKRVHIFVLLTLNRYSQLLLWPLRFCNCLFIFFSHIEAHGNIFKKIYVGTLVI